MEKQTIEAVTERTSRSFDQKRLDLPSYGVARLVGSRASDSSLTGSTYVLTKLEDPLRSEVVLQESQCVPVPQALGVDEALLAPPLAMALSFWDQLHLEIGEAAIYTDGDFFADLVGQVAVWRGGCPVIRLSSIPNKTPLVLGECQYMTDPDETVHQLRERIKEKPGFAAVDLSGRPETIDLLLEVVPRWGRVLLAGRTRQALTVDIYNNVHRKGVLLITSIFDPSLAIQDAASRAYLSAAFRILQNKQMATLCLSLMRAESSVGS